MAIRLETKHKDQLLNWRKIQILQKKIEDYHKEMNVLFHDVEGFRLNDIQENDKAQGIVPHQFLGGKDGVSSFFIISENLINSSHYDFDGSHSISLFLEKRPNVAQGWFFVLPNVMIRGSYKAIIIKLFHGCLIGWDGRVIRHCTATERIGNNNKLYGMYFGSKKYN